jgi:hypothetical protein
MKSQQTYQRTFEELRELASMFWPSDLSEEQAKLSVIPLLLETQDEFITFLSIPFSDLQKLFQIVNLTPFSGNLFLKHLSILADFGGEQLQRVNANFKKLFPSGKLEYQWKEQVYCYEFQKLPVTNLTNNKLGLTGKKLIQERNLDPLLQDVSALLLFGSACRNETTAAILANCEIGEYVGQPEKLTKFIKQRYIWVSRITMGSRSNDLGQLAQKFVLEFLENHLNVPQAQIAPSGFIPGVTDTDAQTNRPTTFDIVVSKDGKYVAIEVSFQVTTNSVIERKAGQAQSRYYQINNAGYKIAYVLDGAGNFQRETALKVLCSYSHCTVAFSRTELDVLCKFLRGYLT